MECTICKLRSAAESCVVCHELLCEECGWHCEECGVTVCEDHLYRTRRGKVLCPECTEIRRQRKKGRHKDHEGGGLIPPTEEEEAKSEGEAGEEALTASAKAGMPAWERAIMLSSALVIITFLLFVIPTWRGAGQPFTLVAVIVGAACAFVFARMGLYDDEHFEFRRVCYVSMGLALLAVVLNVGALLKDPRRALIEDAETEHEQRLQMDAVDRRLWREERLQKYD